MKYTKNNNGFTLVEMMVVLAIIGILAAIAYPGYQTHILKSRRADAKSGLLQLANFMERLYTEGGCYNPGADRICNTGDDGDAPVLPFTTSPLTGTIYYDFSLTDNVGNLTVNALSFSISAVPRTGSPQATDSCGTLTIDNLGNKSAASADCW